MEKIIWAIDAFEEFSDLHKRAAEALRYFSSLKAAPIIQPVFVLNPNHAEVSPDIGSPWVEEYRSTAKISLTQTLSELGLSSVKPPIILGEGTTSVSQGVDLISAYAQQSNADLILVNSHGRSGIKRFFLGSFAETLLHHSHVPVMVIGPKNQFRPVLEEILFPTEFGEHSRVIFRRVATFARDFGASVRLLHIIPKLASPVLDFDHSISRQQLHGEWITLKRYQQYLSEHQQRHAKLWSNWAEHIGVKVEFEIDTQTDTVADSILLHSVMKPSGKIIMMEAQRGAIRDTLLGSVTKTVVRKALCPVWVFTSHFVHDLNHQVAA
jgi:nucleotide-binding universal stress UspA family protein